ncbi:class I SAM-dependent methyltransferase [Streptomyces sp. NBC_01465]|uniref:class I SAM-dependent methyltransferase n=1 Tax=Streptomyces sp. NBC_01465 TaxID=2903878 RepID=UPI002E2F27BF|nr:methyltransferase domain-containing protein [Streptomyces sp. NBC_01465]
MDHRAEISARYDGLAESYDRSGPPFYSVAGELLVQQLELTPGGRILDAGCGRGACLFPAAAAVGPTGQAVGVDISPGMVRKTAADAARLGLAQVKVAVGDAEAPDFADASFDAITSGFVLRQLPDPEAGLDAYRRLLRPGGRLGISQFVSGFPPDWRSVDVALERFAPAAQRSDRVDPPGLARAAGFVDVTTEELTVDVTLEGPAEWWDYLWWSVHRGRVAAIPEARRGEARAAALAAVQGLRAGDGRLVMPIRVRCTTATRPPAP